MREVSGCVWTANGFQYRVLGGDLRGPAASQFLLDVENEDPQELMARLTGNYKRSNERTARNHPRNRAR